MSDPLAPEEAKSIALHPVFLLYGFRYAIGRRSMSALDVSEALIRHRDSLTADWRAKIADEIEQAMANGQIGSIANAARWLEVAEAMKGKD